MDPIFINQKWSGKKNGDLSEKTYKISYFRSLKTQSVEFGPKEPSELLKPRIARVRSSRDQFRTDQLRKPVFDEPEPAQSPLLVRPKKLDPLKPNEHYISETRLSEMR